MRDDEKRAYLEAMVRKNPEGSARHTWAQAMLKAMEVKARQQGKPATSKVTVGLGQTGT